MNLPPDDRNIDQGFSNNTAGSAVGSAAAAAASPTTESSGYTQRITDAAARAKDYVANTASATTTAVDLKLRDLKDQSLGQAIADVREYTRQSPGAVMLISALAGLTVGLLFPWLTFEREESESVREGLAEESNKTFSQYTVEPALSEIASPYVISLTARFQRASLKYNKRLTTHHRLFDTKVIDSIDEETSTLALLTDREVAMIMAEAPDLVVEPNILYKKYRHPLLEGFQELSIPASAGKRTVAVRAVDQTTRIPLPNISIFLMIDQTRRVGFEGVTDLQGICRFTIRNATRKFDALMALPKSGYWNKLHSSVEINDEFEIALQPLPSNQSGLYDWGHQFAQMHDGLSYDGTGVKIGIIDSGIRRDHLGLNPTGGYNCVSGEDPSLWYDDEDGHGTHCAGVIAATLISGRGIKGYVPKAEIRSYRVFGKDADGALTFDIAKAIERAVKDGCDVISMSFGINKPQNAIRIRTDDAYDKGVLCIAATGNDSRSVGYPAAFSSVIGVGAFGKFGSYPDDSLHKATESSLVSTDGRYYCANFSNFGSGIDFCAPGVAIVSTVPGGDYCAWDGTSMACPQVAGMAALALSAHPEIIRVPRDGRRVEKLIEILKKSTQKLGFGPSFEGIGCLTVPPLIVA